ncbi:MAG TPA: hypothetical protein PKW59_10915, partial [Thermotogota bacterium]|nr:hypothetical protein [Thermotogota bacterium]HPM21699.1 hypothetical protein [Thermotogota bacterium]
RDVTFTAVVTAEHVAQFGQIYNTRYMQIPVFFSANLSFEGISFGNFMPGLSDVSSYRVFYDDDLECNVLMLYRAFLDGADEAIAATPFFAAIDFEVLDEEAGFVELNYVDGYGADITPLFKDDKNKNVDGFVIDYDTFILVNGI